MKRSGYPTYYRKRFQHHLFWMIITLLVTSGIAGILAYSAIYMEGNILLASGAIALFLLFVCWFCYETITPIKMALYFEEPVPGPWVWSEVLARHCVYLDPIVAKTGAYPLSFFGFNDDFRNESLVWHAPEKGLETVSKLLQKLRNEPDLVDETETIIADLEKLEIRLRKACENTTQFCFIFHGDGINGMEIEQRRGYF